MVASSTSDPTARIASTLRPSALPPATAARSISPVEIAGTPSRSASRAACVPLPEPGAPKSRTREGMPLGVMSFGAMSGDLAGSASPATDPPALHEPLVVAHHELALDLLQEVHRHADDDEQRGAAEVEADPQALGDEGGQGGVEDRKSVV